MRILVLAQYFPPEVGAASERLGAFVRGLAARGHSVTVLTAFPNYPEGAIAEDYRGKLYSRENWRGAEVIRLWLYATPKSGAAFRLLNYLSFMAAALLAGLLMRRRPEGGVLATSGPIFVPLAGALLARRWRVPFFLDVRDVWPERIIAGTGMKRGRLIRLLERLELWLYEKASRITAVTPGVLENIKAKGPYEEKLRLLTNGVDTELFRPLASEEEESEERRRIRTALWHLPEGAYVLLYAGTLGLLQDTELMLEVARGLAESRKGGYLVTVGGGALKPGFREKARSMGLWNLRVMDAVSARELASWIRSAEVCINANTAHPHNSMAYPVKLFPAMASARPVLTANEGAVVGLIEESGSGIAVPPGDAEAFLEAAERLRDPELRREMGRRGRDLALSDFSHERLVEKLEAILVEVQDD